MNASARQDLRHCFSANAQEVARDLPRGSWRPNAEALQRGLWEHRDAILTLIEERDALDDLFQDLVDALLPFARVAEILKAGENPVLISVPTSCGRTVVQLRPADIRRAAALLASDRRLNPSSQKESAPCA